MPPVRRPAAPTAAAPSLRVVCFLCHGVDWDFLDGDAPALLDAQGCRDVWAQFNVPLLRLADEHPGCERPRSPDAWARVVAAGPPRLPLLPMDVITTWYYAQDWR